MSEQKHLHQSVVELVRLVFRRGPHRVLDTVDVASFALIVTTGALGLFIEGVGVFALVSAMIGGQSAVRSVGSLFGLPSVGPLSYVPPISLLFVVVVLQRVVAPPIAFAANRIGELVANRIRARIIRLATSLPPVHAGAISSGTLASVLNDEAGRCGRASTALITLSQLFIGIIITACVIVAQDFHLSVAAVLAAFPALALYAIVSRRTSADTGRAVSARIRAQADATEGLRTLAAIQAVGGGRSLQDKLLSNADEIRRAETRVFFNLTSLQYLMLVVPIMAAAGALMFSAHRSPTSSLSELLVSLTPIASIGIRMSVAVTFAMSNIYGLSVYAKSVEPVLQLERQLSTLTNGIVDDGEFLESSHANVIRIELKDTGYQLPSGAWLFRRISLPIARSAPLTIRGASGVGKSTLASLIAGMNRPSEGTVAYVLEDGTRRSPAPSLVNYLSQDPAVVAGTIRNNLTLGSQSIPDDEALIDALKKARLWDEVRPKGGLDAPVFEGGRNLSGGQIRRLGIARLLTRSKSIWVFDEPTASLDAANTQLVRDIVTEIGKTMIAIVISHDALHDDGARVLDLHRPNGSGDSATLLARAEKPASGFDATDCTA